MNTGGMDRRDLLRAGAAAMSAVSFSRVKGANERIRLGLAGAGDRGRYVMTCFQKAGGVEVAAVCDVWDARAAQARQDAPAAQPFRDYRAMLDKAALDALLIATPDHWHAPIAIDCLQAGKDVYVEKPLTLRIEEGPAVVKAARVNNRICQVGLQQRSGQHYLQAKRDFFDTGRVGKITKVRTWWNGNDAHLAPVPPALERKPPDLDWAMYLGPAGWREYDPKMYANFRAYLEFGGGQITDLFTHWVDAVHMLAGEDIPVSAVAAGGVYHYQDGRTAPDTIDVLLEYPSRMTVSFEATLASSVESYAIEFIGTGGTLFLSRRKMRFLAAGKGAVPVEADGDPEEMTRNHVADFLSAMRTRRRPNADVLAGHRSAQASHLGNIAYLEKRRIKFDPVRECILPL